MAEILIATERNEKGKTARKKGFIPGIIYGKDREGQSINFERGKLIAFLKEKGEKSKMNFQLNGENKQGIIKEVGRDAVTSSIIHIDIQEVSALEKVRWTIPIFFEGREQLKKKELYIQVYLTEVEVEGKASDIPNNITLNVGNLELGEEVKVKDLNIGSNIRIFNELENTIAIISSSQNTNKNIEEEDPSEVE
ncbi:50S ribosomal protein L25/general stress protein Ctc [Clostridium tetani]|uniref:Large ribosomal subunit protein bL25 n=1 Tax=Clostridium tetani (strain Massachusetts / E88) TaxID=212717 RepID=RL25_CLOTE|nr:50S ribosomal protein L25 [Clostridium tetani]Q896W8.1 RecName: Full=Large ribosomal subunit protein bL25; AltName: Full=50S ribosomal protein L25; AltName: Full=General stress protein CTC [Clostridium tetani E88]AAO35472.1 LSU ribosomal protein L25P [Clostridium tetani E88]AVP55109.1 50S ribosomal protein L25 [Clostridium tetani]RXI46475.1 50S ribosomal protein L25 [Clostridium tetani]RXI52572.1 50S ribosomal protein L25 [Clostridium tetani]RXI56810.1 50S ribosomal protein L25 [Clostridiu